MTSAAEIAARLTPAQKRALLVLPADGSPDEWSGRDRREHWRPWKYVSVEVLRRNGLFRQWVPWPLAGEKAPPYVHRHHADCFALTPLGAEVRAILAAQEAQNDATR